MFAAANNDPARDVKFGNNNDEQLKNMISEYDRNMLQYVANLYEAINKEKMDFEGIGNAVDALSSFNKKQEFNYLNNLLSPERNKGVKIPSPIPIPSCSFQLHNSVTLTTNNSGNLGIVFNPYFLASNNVLREYNIDISGETGTFTIASLSSLFVNNDNSLTGTASNTHWNPINIGQVIPGVYDQYRLVSASIVVKYIGRLDIVSGVIGGAIVFDENPTIGGYTDAGAGALAPTVATSFAKYGNFDLAMDSFYHQENLVLDGIRELYFPIDNSFEEYTRVIDGTHLNITAPTALQVNITAEQDYYKSGFNYFIYVLGAPANSACFKVDVYCNFECLPNASFLNYMPLSITVGSITSNAKKKAILEVQSKPIMKVKDDTAAPITNTSWRPYWNEMARKFRDGLPGIGKLISKGLIYAVPGLKPALSLVGTMMGMDTD